MIPSNVWRSAQAWKNAQDLISGSQESEKPDSSVVAIGEGKPSKGDGLVKPLSQLEKPLEPIETPAKPPAKRRR